MERRVEQKDGDMLEYPFSAEGSSVEILRWVDLIMTVDRVVILYRRKEVQTRVYRQILSFFQLGWSNSATQENIIAASKASDYTQKHLAREW